MKDKLNEAIGDIGYDMLDNFVCKAMGISKGNIIADLYLADIEIYTDTQKQAYDIRQKVLKKYGIKDKMTAGYMQKWPIALIALFILENGNYFDKIKK